MSVTHTPSMMPVTETPITQTHPALSSPTTADPAKRRAWRILLVTPSYYPDSHGGAERQAKILSHALAAREAKVTLVQPVIERGYAAAETTAFGQIRRFRVSAPPAQGGRFIGVTLWWTLRTMLWVLRHRADFDAVYIFHGRLHAIGPLAGAWLSGVPAFIKPGGGGEASDFAALYAKKFGYGHLAAKLVVGATAGFIANSTSIQNDLIAEGVSPTRVRKIPNGVRTPTAGAVGAAQASRTGRRFIYSGRLFADKGVSIIIDAAAKLAAMGLEFELSIIGDGPALPSLKQQAVDLGLAERVRFPGRIDDVYPELLAHDAFLSASLREGQSNALLEALSAGLVPICANASGVSDVVQEGLTGFVLPEATPDDLAEAMAGFLRLPDARRKAMGSAAADWAAKTLDIDQIATLTLAAFAEISDHHASGRP